MTYKEKLQDPRWQKKRLEILSRDNFTCQLCNDKETTLHVHHNQYISDPWDVENDKLITYCQYCHRIVEFTKNIKIYNKILKIYNRKSPLGVLSYSFIIDELGNKWVVVNLLNDDINLIDFLDGNLINNINLFYNN